jgi:hypothetical protein
MGPLPKSIDPSVSAFLSKFHSVISGDDAGTNEAADAVHAAADGTDLNDFWDEVQQVVAARNAQRDRLIGALTFRVTELAEEVTLPSPVDFEKSSEYGLPKSIRQAVSRFWRGYSFDFYDLAIRFTWRFIADADIRQLRQLTNSALEADDRLMFNQVFKCLFNSLNGTGITDQNLPVTVYKFYNGDAEVPPTYKTNTFTAPHNHYLTTHGISGSNTLVPATLDGMQTQLDHHGYGVDNGYNHVLWVNPQEEAIIRTFRVATGATWDFLQTAPYGGGIVQATDTRIVGQPTGTYRGQTGTYGPWHVVKEDYIPAGYLVGLVSGGVDNIGNPIGLREHKNPRYRGLKVLPGNNNDYPLIESFFQRGIGTGIRHRGAGVLCQVTSSDTYTIPAIYA